MVNKGRIAALLLALAFCAGAFAADEKQAIADFKKAMKSKNERDRIGAVCALARVPGKKATGLVRKVVRSDRSERVQAAAALALSRREDPKDLRYLMAALRSLKKKPIALAGAVDGIATYGDAKTAEAVYDIGRYWMPKHKYPTLAAIRALGAVRTGESVELLLKLYDLTYVRGGMGGSFGPDSGGGGVASGYTSDDTQARMADFRPHIVDSLRRLTGEAYPDDMDVWNEWWEDNEKTFDPAAVVEDPNQLMDLTCSRYGYSIRRPEETWKWLPKPDAGFSRTAVFEEDGRTIGRLSILAYSTWSREPSKLEEMAAQVKAELERTTTLITEKKWDRAVKFAEVDAIRHRVTGIRNEQVTMVERTILLHREVMYVIDLSLTRAVGGSDREDARRFIDSFKLLN